MCHQLPIEAVLLGVHCGVVVGTKLEFEAAQVIGRDVDFHVDRLPGSVSADDDSVGISAAGLVKPRLLVPGIAADAAFTLHASILVLNTEVWERQMRKKGG